MELGLARKVAVVTDASRGIGAAIAADLAAEETHVCPAARDSAAVDAVAARLAKNSVESLARVADPRDPTCPDVVVNAAVMRLGRLDLQVSNAAAIKCLEFFAATEEICRTALRSSSVAMYG